MRLILALGVLGGFAGAMAAGMVMAVHGKPGLLLATLTLFLVLFAWVGCREPSSS